VLFFEMDNLSNLSEVIFRRIIGYVSPFDNGNLSDVSDLMRLASVSKRVRTRVVRFLAEPATSARARACVFSDPLKFTDPMVTERPLGLLLLDDPLSTLGSRRSSRISRSGVNGTVADPNPWSLVNVGSIALTPSQDRDMKKRLVLLGCMVPDLRDVHLMMPDTLPSRTGSDVNIHLLFPATVTSASIGTDHPTCVCNVNVSGSSVIQGECIEEFMIIAPSVRLTSIATLVIPKARSLLMSCSVLSFAGIGRLTSLTSLVTRVGGIYVECEPDALTCIGELHGLRHLGMIIPSAWPVTKGALAYLTRLCSLEVHATVDTVCELVQVADLSIKDVTELHIIRDEWDEARVVNSGIARHITEPLGFLTSARSMVHLSLQWCACVFVSPFLIILSLMDKALCLFSGALFCSCSAKLTSVASLDIANLAGTLTKLQITRCPKLRDVGRLTGLTGLVELGIYECPAVIGMLNISELPRLTHLSIDLIRATRAHLGSVAVPLRSLLLNSYTPVDDGILSDADSIVLWLISDQGQWPKVTVAHRYGEAADGEVSDA